MKKATISSIDRVEGTYKYKITLSDKLNGKTKYYIKFNPNEPSLKKMFANLANLFKLWNPKYREDVKASIVMCMDYYGLIDKENKSINFNSLVGKEVTLTPKNCGLSYSSIKKEFTESTSSFITLSVGNRNHNSMFLSRAFDKIKKKKKKIKKTFKLLRSFGSEVKVKVSNEVDLIDEKILKDIDLFLKERIITKRLSLLSNRKLLYAVVEYFSSVINEITRTYDAKIDSLVKENKKLHEENKSLHKRLDKLEEDYKKIKEENKKLHEEIKLMHSLMSKNNGIKK